VRASLGEGPNVFMVIFEVKPKPERWDDYLRSARWLTPELEQVDGFLANERFRSGRRDGWVVSVSTWRDEKALIRWRTRAAHHGMQERGRAEVFHDYHLRVGEVAADTAAPRGHVPPGQRFDATAVGSAKVVTVTQRTLARAPAASGVAPRAASLDEHRGGTPPGLVDWDVFDGLADAGTRLWLRWWQDAEAARAWLAAASAADRHRMVRVIRDYSMVDRAEAPQYYPPVTTPKVG